MDKKRATRFFDEDLRFITIKGKSEKKSKEKERKDKDKKNREEITPDVLLRDL